MSIVRGFELHRVSCAKQDRIHRFYGVGTHFVTEHVNSHDGQHVRARDRTKRKGMDETGNDALYIIRMDFVCYRGHLITIVVFPQWAKIVVTLERAVPQKAARNYLEEYSIQLAPGDDLNPEQRGFMVIKCKSQTRAKQRKGAVINWKVRVEHHNITFFYRK